METIKIKELEKIREIYEGFIYSKKHDKELLRLIGSEILLDSFFSDKRIILYIESIVKLFIEFDINDITDDIIKKNIYNNADCKYSVLLIKVPKEYDLESIKSEKFNLYHFDKQRKHPRFLFECGDESFISESEEEPWLEKNELFIEFVNNLFGSDTGDKYYLEFINFDTEDHLIQATAFGIRDNNLIQSRKEISSYFPIDRVGIEFDSNIVTFDNRCFYFSYCPGYFGYNCWRQFCSKTPNNNFYFRASNLKDLIYVESMFIDRSIIFNNDNRTFNKIVYMDDLFDTLVVQTNVLINVHSIPYIFYPKSCLVLLTNSDTINELRDEQVVTDMSSFQFNNKKLCNTFNNIINGNLDYFIKNKLESVVLPSKYNNIEVNVDVYLDDSFKVDLNISPLNVQKFSKNEKEGDLISFHGAYFSSSLVWIAGTDKNGTDTITNVVSDLIYDFKFNNKVVSVNNNIDTDFSITKNIKDITCLDNLHLIRGKVLQKDSSGEYIKKDMKIFNQIINSSKAEYIKFDCCFRDFDFTDNELVLPDNKEYIFGGELFKRTTITSSMLKSIVEGFNSGKITSVEKIFVGSTVVGDDKIVIKKPIIYADEFSDMSRDGNVELILSEDVSKIEQRAFNNCSLIRNIKISSNVIDVEDAAFRKSGLETVDLSEATDNISGDYCFENCRNLVSVKLPNTTECNCRGMFERCNNLKKVTIPSGMKAISGRMFNSCRNLSVVEFEGYIEEFGEESFLNCVNLKELKNLKTSRLIEICSRAFSGCANLSINKEIKTRAISIHSYAFFNCCSISSLSIKVSQILLIGEGAFSQTGLEEISFSGSGKASFDKSFMNAYFLKKVDINMNSDIGSFSFMNCKLLEEVVLHKENKYSFERNVFKDCFNLKSIHIPAGSLAYYKPFFNYTMAGLNSIKVYVDLNNGNSVHVNNIEVVYDKIIEIFYDLFNNSSISPESFRKILLNAINVYNSENSNFPIYNFIQIPRGKNVDPDEYDNSVINSLNLDRNNPIIVSFKLLKSISESCSGLSIVIPVDSEYFYIRFKEISEGLAKINYLETLYYKNGDTLALNVNKNYSLLLVDIGFYTNEYEHCSSSDDDELGNFQTSIKCKNSIQPYGSDELEFKYKKDFIEKYIKSSSVGIICVK